MRRFRSAVSVFVVAAVFATGLITVADAHHSCYPGRCDDGDAKLKRIAAPRQVFRGQQTFARVDGANVGAPSNVATRLRFSKGHVQPFGDTVFHVGTHEPYSVYFRITPTGSGRAFLKACTEAQPRDENRSNNCGRTRVRILTRR